MWSGVEGDDFVLNTDIAEQQVYATRIFELKDGEKVTVTPLQYNQMAFDDRGTARLIFEGVSGNDRCMTQQKTCFLKLTIKDKGTDKIAVSTKLYIDLHDIKDFYAHHTVGTGIEQEPEDTVKVDIPGVETTLFTPDNLQDKVDYVLFIHGWRMPYEERVSFAETTLKRLYWAGYKGKFGTFSWPTTWFFKPAYANTLETLGYIFGDITSYSRGEKIARNSGKFLKKQLEEIKQDHNSLQVIAHSMGNLVIGEALKLMDPGIVDNYIATQAATSSGAYDSDQTEMNFIFIGKPNDATPTDDYLSWVTNTDCTPYVQLSFEAAWRCANISGDSLINSDYDIPPDHYRYTINTEKHGLPPNGEGITKIPYYAGISNKTKIHNFFNPIDAALDGWRLQQVTKPDSGKSILEALDLTTGYFYEAVFNFINPYARDVFKNDNVRLNWLIEAEKFEILASIVPSRTAPLGQVSLGNTTEINGISLDLEYTLKFTDSNYDHSAQWMQAYHNRSFYWDSVCLTFFGENSTCLAQLNK